MKTACLVLPIFLAATCPAQQGWNSHEGGLLKYRVMIRFGEEPDTLPDGWRFGRVSAVAVDSAGNVYVVDADQKQVLKLPAGADAPIVLPFTGLKEPVKVAVDAAGNVYVTDIDSHQVLKLAAA